MGGWGLGRGGDGGEDEWRGGGGGVGRASSVTPSPKGPVDVIHSQRGTQLSGGPAGEDLLRCHVGAEGGVKGS